MISLPKQGTTPTKHKPYRVQYHQPSTWEHGDPFQKGKVLQQIKVIKRLTWLTNHITHIPWLTSLCQSYGFLEYFCGYGWVSMVMRSQGVETASFDINLGNPEEGKQNNMDLTCPAGFASLIRIYKKRFLMITPNAPTSNCFGSIKEISNVFISCQRWFYLIYLWGSPFDPGFGISGLPWCRCWMRSMVTS